MKQVRVPGADLLRKIRSLHVDRLRRAVQVRRTDSHPNQPTLGKPEGSNQDVLVIHGPVVLGVDPGNQEPVPGVLMKIMRMPKRQVCEILY